MNKVNGKLTVIFENLDDPESEPLKIIDEMHIEELSYEMHRPHKQVFAQGAYRPSEHIPGPFSGMISFKERTSLIYENTPGKEFKV